MKINIVAGGPLELIPSLELFNGQQSVWVGVDRGVYYLMESGILPERAFGDFDSVSEEELEMIERKVPQLNKFKPEKDETDMELALNWAIEQEPESITIFGATGGRLDHLMANVQLLVKPVILQSGIQIELIDKYNTVYVKEPGSYKVARNEDLKYISFLPVTPSVSGMTLENFKYPLKDRHIPLGSTLCISNELIGDHGTFSFSEGILLVVRSRD
ncbi:thiamine diphosphokinase [Bacillus sp. REN3]|uniref:thiamine diphosphokinase n=1 Tax=Bacillus sp. REN3 TaxID=2802440 RepID=UPI001AEEE588|nr:thiamine diphosphokinase [Bacillus sp. REN3]